MYRLVTFPGRDMYNSVLGVRCSGRDDSTLGEPMVADQCTYRAIIRRLEPKGLDDVALVASPFTASSGKYGDKGLALEWTRSASSLVLPGEYSIYSAAV